MKSHMDPNTGEMKSDSRKLDTDSLKEAIQKRRAKISSASPEDQIIQGDQSMVDSDPLLNPPVKHRK